MKRILALLVTFGYAHAATGPLHIPVGDAAPKVQVDLRHATTGALLTGLTSTSASLAVSCLPSDTATAFTYAATTDIETITTIGTYVNPGTGDLGFKETASTGVYEFQFEPGMFDNATSAAVMCKVSGATNLLDKVFAISQNILTSAQMAAAVHADLATGTPIPVNVKVWDDDATAPATFEAWIDAGALPSDLVKANGTNITASAGRPEVNSTLFSGVATGSATLAAADDAVITLIGTAGAGLTNINLPNQTMDVTGTWTGNIVGTVSTLTTYTGNTLQTGDSFARIGAAGASLTAVDDAVITLIGTAGAGLTAIPDVDSLLAALVLTPLLTADSGTNVTLVDAALTEATNNWFSFGAAVVFTSGTLARQVRCITGFTATTPADTLRWAPAVTTAVTTHTYYLIAAPGCAILGNP